MLGHTRSKQAGVWCIGTCHSLDVDHLLVVKVVTTVDIILISLRVRFLKGREFTWAGIR